MHLTATADMDALPEQLPTGDTVSLKSENSIGSLFVSVYDIFLEVCKTLLASEGGRADLLRLTTVNRAVSDVALDVLWETQDTITNLFRILPLIEEQRVLLTLPNPDDTLTDDEYARFMGYAIRVKVFSDLGYDPEVHPLIDERLLRCALGRGPILPNLHKLRIGGPTETTLDKACTEVQLGGNGPDAILANGPDAILANGPGIVLAIVQRFPSSTTTLESRHPRTTLPHPLPDYLPWA
ncbi:hypothetical protein BD626DRAFT_574889 [Schizophyllum amplum]|uniref:Uncharacterized protein n=1 Tax=Schizophyllum amplum TaxID=97359 RepID=A0A550BX15_9AGAR|nr:hypothetical protein BD626DRAFT_574889 [Auriculariopsis ampla]